MDKILLATTNQSKIKPFAYAWEQSRLSKHFELLLPENLSTWQDLHILENTGSFDKDALKKAQVYADYHNLIVLCLDRGISFDALGRWPGTKTKEVLAGNEDRILSSSDLQDLEKISDKKEADLKRAELVIRLLDGKERKMKSVYGIAAAFPEGPSKCELIEVNGIATENLNVGPIGYFYDWFFIPDGYDKVLSKFTEEEYLEYVSTVLWPIPSSIEEFLITNKK